MKTDKKTSSTKTMTRPARERVLLQRMASRKLSALKLEAMRGLQQALLDAGLPQMPVSVLENMRTDDLFKLRVEFIGAVLRQRWGIAE